MDNRVSITVVTDKQKYIEYINANPHLTLSTLAKEMSEKFGREFSVGWVQKHSPSARVRKIRTKKLGLEVVKKKPKKKNDNSWGKYKPQHLQFLEANAHLPNKILVEKLNLHFKTDIFNIRGVQQKVFLMGYRQKEQAQKRTMEKKEAKVTKILKEHYKQEGAEWCVRKIWDEARYYLTPLSIHQRATTLKLRKIKPNPYPLQKLVDIVREYNEVNGANFSYTDKEDGSWDVTDYYIDQERGRDAVRELVCRLTMAGIWCKVPNPNLPTILCWLEDRG